MIIFYLLVFQTLITLPNNINTHFFTEFGILNSTVAVSSFKPEIAWVI